MMTSVSFASHRTGPLLDEYAVSIVIVVRLAKHILLVSVSVKDKLIAGANAGVWQFNQEEYLP